MAFKGLIQNQSCEIFRNFVECHQACGVFQRNAISEQFDGDEVGWDFEQRLEINKFRVAIIDEIHLGVSDVFNQRNYATMEQFISRGDCDAGGATIKIYQCFGVKSGKVG